VTIEALVMGRVGADLYPNQSETPLARARTFTRFAGGFAANVATGLARLGVGTAIWSRVGADGHGEMIRGFLAGEGVDVAGLGTDPAHRTPVVFCELWPPDRFPLLFYREPTAPDWELSADDVDLAEVAAIPLLFASGTGLAREPSAELTLGALAAHRGTTVLDLDWRPDLWEGPSDFPGRIERAAASADVVVGNRAELAAATGAEEPEEAVRRLRGLGPRLVVEKRGPGGAAAHSDAGSHEVPGIAREIVNGLGAGDAFDAALGYGLLRELPIEETLDLANAAGAIVAGGLACSEAMPTLDELRAFSPAGSPPADRISDGR